MQGRIRQCAVLASVLVVGLAAAPRALADDHARGVIQMRNNDGTLIVRADDSSIMTVVLNEFTKVRLTSGARVTKAAASDLIPGLRVKLEGVIEGAARFTAERVTFSRDDLKTALAIQGGVDPTDQRSLDNQMRLNQQALLLQQQQQALNEHGRQIADNSGRISANEQKIVGTAGALNARLSNLADYNTLTSITVLFANGRASIPKGYKAQLQQFAAQAKATPGFAIQIEGFASDVGPGPLNQKLSQQRADNVTPSCSRPAFPSPTSSCPPRWESPSRCRPTPRRAARRRTDGRS